MIIVIESADKVHAYGVADLLKESHRALIYDVEAVRQRNLLFAPSGYVESIDACNPIIAHYWALELAKALTGEDDLLILVNSLLTSLARQACCWEEVDHGSHFHSLPGYDGAVACWASLLVSAPHAVVYLDVEPEDCPSIRDAKELGAIRGRLKTCLDTCSYHGIYVDKFDVTESYGDIAYEIAKKRLGGYQQSLPFN